MILSRLIKMGRYVNQYPDRKYDRKYKLDTYGQVKLSDLTINSENTEYGVDYSSTSIRRFKAFMSFLPKDLRDFVFIDYGSGKGKLLTIASEYYFKKIIGVEFSQEIHSIAQNNIAKYRSKSQKCFDVQSVFIDASEYLIPDDRCIFYFFNPFRESIMLQVLGNIQKSYLRNPRKIYIVLYNPVLAHLVEKLQFMERMKKTGWSLKFWRVRLNNLVFFYESLP